MTKNVLLTGGFGTLGGRLSELLAQDSEIKLRLASRETRSAPSWAPKAQTIQVDFERSESIEEMMDGITTVVHLVAMNDYECRAEPELARQVNTEYTRRLIDCCKKDTRLIYVSTIQIYGNDLSGIISEHSKPDPKDAYAQTHFDAETLVKSANNSGEISGISLRNANGFGAPMSRDAKIWQILANDLCRQIVEKKRMVIKSHGQHYRNFITFADVARAIQHCINMDESTTQGGTFNLSSDYTMKILEMAELIASRCEKVLGFRPELQILGQQPAVLPTKFEYDSSKLRSTGFTPSTKIDDEIDRLLRSCQKWFGEAK